MDSEAWIRIGIFLGILAAMMGWELLAPRRGEFPARRRRWPGNLGIVVLDALALRLVFPGAAVGMAVLAGQQGWGIFNQLAVPVWLAGGLSFLVLDAVIYAQHVVFHKVPVLWRLHRMHHSDMHFDVTTGLRFHPLEILISMALKWAVVAALGAPAVAVLIFEVVLNGTSMFNHGNVKLPVALDRRLRWLVVTPDMHRVHHSWVRRETDSNFGFNLPWWDRLFGTYRAQPEAGQDGMTIGLDQFRASRESRLPSLLTQPFRNDKRR